MKILWTYRFIIASTFFKHFFFFWLSWTFFKYFSKHISNLKSVGTTWFYKYQNPKFVFHRNGKRVGFGPGFFIPRPDPRAKTCDPDPARLLSGVFFRGPDPAPPEPAGPVKGLSPISGPTKKKKKRRIEAQIYFCHIQPAYSNSSLDNVAQMQSLTKKEKKKKN